MSISMDNIIQAINSVRQQKSENSIITSNEDSPNLSEEEKNVILMLEASGFFDGDFSEDSLEKIFASSRFVSENINEIFERTIELEKNEEPTPCPICGTVGVSGAAFCYKCGSKIIGAKSRKKTFRYIAWEDKYLEVTKIPGFEISTCPITQDTWNMVMKFDPSYFKGDKKPVDGICWYDAIYFCNMLSELSNYEPCYSVLGKKDPRTWGYIPGSDDMLFEKPECDFHANGFRLPTVAEWKLAASGRDNYRYSGSDSVNEVAWFNDNSYNGSQEIRGKQPNSYGLYDMSGNIYEWCWDEIGEERAFCGGSWKSRAESCAIDCVRSSDPSEHLKLFGLRVVRSV